MTNTIDFETMRQVEKLTRTFGLDKCKRLGFIHIDENGVAALSPVGLGYLLYIEGLGINTVAAAFAAGAGRIDGLSSAGSILGNLPSIEARQPNHLAYLSLA